MLTNTKTSRPWHLPISSRHSRRPLANAQLCGYTSSVLDLEDLDYVLSSMKLLGSKGTTGTQASFLELFEGDHEKCRKADQMIAEKMGFTACYPVSGQTYSRKIDTRVLNVLAGIAQSAHKFTNDIRLLQHLKRGGGAV